MRKSLILLPLLLCASPALAQRPAPQLPPELTDPATAQRITDAMQALSGAGRSALYRGMYTPR